MGILGIISPLLVGANVLHILSLNAPAHIDRTLPFHYVRARVSPSTWISSTKTPARRQQYLKKRSDCARCDCLRFNSLARGCPAIHRPVRTRGSQFSTQHRPKHTGWCFVLRVCILFAYRSNPIKGAQDNKEAWGRLGNDTCELVYAVLVIYREQESEGKEMPRDLTDNLRDLVG